MDIGYSRRIAQAIVIRNGDHDYILDNGTQSVSLPGSSIMGLFVDKVCRNIAREPVDWTTLHKRIGDDGADPNTASPKLRREVRRMNKLLRDELGEPPDGRNYIVRAGDVVRSLILRSSGRRLWEARDGCRPFRRKKSKRRGLTGDSGYRRGPVMRRRRKNGDRKRMSDWASPSSNLRRRMGECVARGGEVGGCAYSQTGGRSCRRIGLACVRMVAHGLLKHYRFGGKGRRGCIRIEEADLDAFLAACLHEIKTPVPPLKHIRLNHG